MISARSAWPRRRARVLELACLVAAGVALALALGLLTAIATRGVPSLSLAFLLEPSRGSGSEGGVRWQIVGTLWMTFVAAVLVAPLALSVAVVQTQLAGPRGASSLRSLLHLLNAVPSILFGLFGFVVLVNGLGLGKSWLVGSALLAAMTLPTVSVATAEAMAAVPQAYVETARGLGLSRGRALLAVVLPQSFHGLWRGLLLGAARAVGETAPLLFTAVVFSGATFPAGVRDEPVLALPYHVFVLSQDAYDPAASAAAWGAATVLVLLVAAGFATGRPLRRRAHEEARG